MGVTYHRLSENWSLPALTLPAPERISDGKLFFDIWMLPFEFISELNSSGQAASCWLHARGVIAKIPRGQSDQISRMVETLMSRVDCQLGSTVVKALHWPAGFEGA